MPTKCFLLEMTNVQKVYARTYSSRLETCPISINGYHNKMNWFSECLVVFDKVENYVLSPNIEKPSNDDPIWPKTCDCGYEFKDSDTHMLYSDIMYQRKDTGEIYSLKDAPPGAMWNSWWVDNTNPDGLYLTVKLPTGYEWDIDSRASNCTKRDDDIHRCWVRHGIAPEITVDKNGLTCGAGAGSIMVPGYHGFLKNGYLTDSI